MVPTEHSGWSLPRTIGPVHTAMGTGAFLDSDAARPGPLDLPPQDSLDPSLSTDFFCHHGPPRAGGFSLHKLSSLLSIKLWLTRNTQAWPRLGSQIAHIEHIVKWVKPSKGTGCFWDHMWVGVWRTGKGICMKAPVWLYSRIQYYCLPNFLLRVPNTQAHKGVMVIHCTEAAYSTYFNWGTHHRHPANRTGSDLTCSCLWNVPNHWSSDPLEHS